MSGIDLRDLIFDYALRQARFRRKLPRRLTGRTALIVLGLLTVIIVLPVCLARSGGRTTAPVADAEGSPANDSVLPVWSELPGTSVDRSPGAADAVGPETPVESFTAYPSPVPAAASSTAIDKQQLVEEIQRRLAGMKAGTPTAAAEQPNPVWPPGGAASPPPASSRSFDLDANAPLQLFQPTGRVAPAEAARASSLVQSEPSETAPSKSLPDVHLAEIRPDPNLNLSPAAQAAFNRHFEAAKNFLHQGQYVRAADAFTLALAYRPADVNAYLGKGHALFAAGRYAGSAAALARAVEFDSQAALKKVDLVALAGGPDEFIARFNDLAQQAQANPAPEEHFLLAYIYDEMDQLPQAGTAVEAAASGSFSPASVAILKAAIDR
jgi:hypothetical protein